MEAVFDLLVSIGATAIDIERWLRRLAEDVRDALFEIASLYFGGVRCAVSGW